VASAEDRPGMMAEDLRVTGSPKLASLGVDMILGRDILSRCLLVYEGYSKRFTLAFDRSNIADN
jgi:hypothetical protein